jgi:hypothetical protein
MPKRTRTEITEADLEETFDFLFNISAVDFFPDFKKNLTALKIRALSDVSGKVKHQAATDFTVPIAIETFGLKFTESLDEYHLKHFWDIENEVGMKEFPTTPCIGETLMPSR